jgi:hypothetical protein
VYNYNYHYDYDYNYYHRRCRPDMTLGLHAGPIVSAAAASDEDRPQQSFCCDNGAAYCVRSVLCAGVRVWRDPGRRATTRCWCPAFACEALIDSPEF